jgi:hypothetical protein
MTERVLIIGVVNPTAINTNVNIKGQRRPRTRASTELSPNATPDIEVGLEQTGGLDVIAFGADNNDKTLTFATLTAARDWITNDAIGQQWAYNMQTIAYVTLSY